MIDNIALGEHGQVAPLILGLVLQEQMLQVVALEGLQQKLLVRCQTFKLYNVR